MIHISRKKGMVLAIAIYFMMIAAITSIGIYTYSYYIQRNVNIGKRSSVTGYYCALAGARWTYALLTDPVGNLKSGTGAYAAYITSGTITTAKHDDSPAETVTLTITPGTTFGDAIGLRGNEKVTVVITEWTTGVTEWTNGNYKIIATYSNK